MPRKGRWTKRPSAIPKLPIRPPPAAASKKTRWKRSALSRACGGISPARKEKSSARTKKIAEYERAIAAGETIEAGYQQLLAARESQSAIAELLSQRGEINGEIHRLEGELTEQRAELMREAEVLRERVKGLEETLKAGAAAEIETIQSDLRALEKLDAERNKATKDMQQLRVRRSEFTTRLGRLKTDGTALNERMERLQLADGAACPLCGQKLTEKHRDDMLAQLTAERDAMRAQYREYTSAIHDYDRRRAELEQELESWAQTLKDLPALQQKLGAAAELRRNAEAAEAALQLEILQLAQLEKRLNEKDFGHELRRQLAALNEQRDRLAIDPDTHAKTQSKLADLAAFDRQYTQLEFAKLNLPEAQHRRAQTAERLAKLEAALTADQAKLEQIREEIATLADKVEKEREYRAEVERIRAEVQEQRERKAICEQELHAIAAGRDNKQRLTSRLVAARSRQSLFDELRVAFGRNGVPAMIIETAVPELEAEANDLLARLTDGRMSLRIATQRERLSGGLVETLELEIADELGTRAYELYSGGEAFRINFAIRIALSKLLARRAGAQLRALFIDEGFGSQDEDGRDKLVDAINKIKSGLRTHPRHHPYR